MGSACEPRVYGIRAVLSEIYVLFYLAIGTCPGRHGSTNENTRFSGSSSLCVWPAEASRQCCIWASATAGHRHGISSVGLCRICDCRECLYSSQIADPILYSIAAYSIGLMLYAFDFPERLSPSFNTLLHSHQFWHVSIVAAIALHWWALQSMSEKGLQGMSCGVEHGSLDWTSRVLRRLEL